MKQPLATPTRPASSSRSHPRMVWETVAMTLVVVALVAMAWGCLKVQGTAAAYVRGESLWAKGQKEAVIALHRLADPTSGATLAQFELALRIPLADHRARIELDSPEPDYDVAVRAFAEGGNKPDDARAMARLYPAFSQVPDVRRAVQSWVRGDSLIDSLRRTAAVLAGVRGDARARAALLLRVEELDRELTLAETEFSNGLGDATRMLPLQLGLLTLFVGVLLVGFGVVLTRRLQRETRLTMDANYRRSEEFRALVEDAPDIIARLDRNGRHLYVNSVVSRTLGIPSSAFLGRNHAELAEEVGCDPQFADGWREAVDHVVATGTAISFDSTYLGASGQRWFEARLAPQRAPDGRVESVITVSRDVTDLRSSERALRERDEQLRHSQKLDAVGQLAGGIAHDFNNILTAIIANLDLAKGELTEKHPAAIDVEAAATAARRATTLTRQLLTFGRRQFIESARIDVNALVTEMHDILSRLVGEQVHVEMDLHPGPVAVNGDSDQLQQVLMNLIVNARDAMPAGGTVYVATSIVRSGAAPCALLAVRDTGIGMSIDTQKRACEPFFTTKPRGQGTGLGLSIVHGIIEQSGGSMVIESARDQGTTVRMSLPLSTREAAVIPRVTSSSVVPDAISPQAATILLVEDEQTVRQAVKRLLERAGHRVLDADCAEAALVIWWREKPSIGVLLTDVMMPGMDGWSLLSALRANRPELSAVVMSGYTGATADASLLSDDAFTSTLSKPFDGAQLIERVREALQPSASATR
ncbi:MAG: ATP-binding protein [bacterium]